MIEYRFKQTQATKTTPEAISQQLTPHPTAVLTAIHKKHHCQTHPLFLVAKTEQGERHNEESSLLQSRSGRHRYLEDALSIFVRKDLCF